MADLLFTATDPEGRAVSLSRAWYEAHIQGRHQEIDDPSMIEQTITDPDSIWQETRQAGSFVYYREGVHPDRPHLHLRVVSRHGEVMTAHLINRGTG